MLTAIVVLMGETLAPSASKGTGAGTGGEIQGRHAGQGRQYVGARRQHRHQCRQRSHAQSRTARPRSESRTRFRVRRRGPADHLVAWLRALNMPQRPWTLARRAPYRFSPKRRRPARPSAQDAVAIRVSIRTCSPQHRQSRIPEPARAVAQHRLSRSQQAGLREFSRGLLGRMFYPLNVLVLAFCAVPFAFGALRSGGLAKRLFIGIVLSHRLLFPAARRGQHGRGLRLASGVRERDPAAAADRDGIRWFRRHA